MKRKPGQLGAGHFVSSLIYTKNRKMGDHPAAMYPTPAGANRKPVGLIAQLAERYISIAEIINISLVFSVVKYNLIKPIRRQLSGLFFFNPVCDFLS